MFRAAGIPCVTISGISTSSGKLKDTADKVASSVKEGYDKYKSQAAGTVADASRDIETELDALK